ncbi:MAG: hypothetical protein NZM06_02925 [Chloroherpetonaceae bacterium]|nr:hypothetical protein [Chloroherpetonaceae bacterium]MDW8437249.1 hypothetical protein [Chloroherpetonaceae bacterium]
MRFILKYIELILTAAGIVVIMVVPSLFSTSETDLVAARATTAILVGVLHGVIFFVIRHRQRQVREATIDEIRAMLKDVINNHLTVISVSAAGSSNVAKATERIKTASANISEALDNISEESLSSWKSRYSSALSEANS